MEQISQRALNATRIFSGQLLTYFLALLNALAISRALGPEGRGGYALAVQVLGIGVVTALCGSNLATVKFMADDLNGGRELFASCLWLSLFSSTIVGGVGLMIYMTYLPFQMTLSILPVAVILIQLPVCTFQRMLQGMIVGKNSVRAYNLLQILDGCMGPISLGLWLFNRLTFSTMLVAWLASNLTLCFANILILRREASLRFQPRLIWQLMKYGAPLGLTSLLGQTYLRFDLLYLGLKATLAEVGLYSIAVLVERISFIPGSIGVASASSYAVLERQTGLRMALSGFRKAALLTGLAALGLCTFGFWVMEWVFGPAFRESYWLLLVLLPGALLSSLIQAISGFVIYQVGRSTLLWAQVIYLSILLLGSPVGFSLLGVAGVAAATTLANCFYFFAVIMICRSRVPGFRSLELLPRTDDFHSLIGQGKRFLSSVA